MTAHNRSKAFLRHTLLAAGALIVAAPAANAAGFYIQEQSVRGLGSAFSGSTTTLNDASTIYFNPSGMTNLAGGQAQAGVHVLVPYAKISDTGSTAAPTAAAGGAGGNPYDPTPVPNGFLSYQLGDSWWAGIAVTAPFGLASEYNAGWFGRFDSTKTELKVIDIQPTIAFKVNDYFSIGAGVNIQKADADLQQRVMLGAATEGNFRLNGDDFGYGYTIGAQLKPWDHTVFGVNYKSEVHHNLDGRIRVSQLNGTLVGAQSSGGSAKLTTPDILTFGAAHQMNEKLTLQGQATWFGWNNFDNIAAYRDSGALVSTVPQNYQTTWAFALGAEYMLNDAWMLRGGVQFDETPTTDEYRTSRTPDGDRTWLSAGATYAVTPALDLDMAATYIHVASEELNVTRTTATGNAVLRGDTESRVGILAFGLNYKF